METVRNVIMDNCRQLLNDNRPTNFTAIDGSQETQPFKIAFTHCGDFTVFEVIGVFEGIKRKVYSDGTISIDMTFNANQL